jgi:hypothetical protein
MGISNSLKQFFGFDRKYECAALPRARSGSGPRAAQITVTVAKLGLPRSQRYFAAPDQDIAGTREWLEGIA